MSEKSNFEQKGGDNSTNIQGSTVTFQYGINYSEAKDIALEIFRNNFLNLSHQAAETAKNRAEELVQNFLNKLALRNPESINNIVDPGIQYSLYTAQKEFARTGDKDISDIYIDLLIDRIGLVERDIKQIAYDESLNTITKLTSKQIDTLTLIFLVKYAPSSGSMDIDFSVKDIFSLFGVNFSYEKSYMDQLIYTGTAILGKTAISIESLFLNNYKYCISLGPSAYTKADQKKINEFMDNKSLAQYLVPSPINENKKVLPFFNEEDLIRKLTKNNISLEDINLCKLILRLSEHLAYAKIAAYLKSQGDIVNKIQECWNNSELKYFELTTVGQIIAQANYSRKTGKHINLAIWNN